MPVRLLELIDLSDNVFYGSRNEAPVSSTEGPRHGVRLSRACLSRAEHTHSVAIQALSDGNRPSICWLGLGRTHVSDDIFFRIINYC